MSHTDVERGALVPADLELGTETQSLVIEGERVFVFVQIGHHLRGRAPELGGGGVLPDRALQQLDRIGVHALRAKEPAHEDERLRPVRGQRHRARQQSRRFRGALQPEAQLRRLQQRGKVVRMVAERAFDQVDGLGAGVAAGAGPPADEGKGNPPAVDAACGLGADNDATGLLAGRRGPVNLNGELENDPLTVFRNRAWRL